MGTSRIQSTDRVAVNRPGVTPDGQFEYVPVGELFGEPRVAGDVPAALLAAGTVAVEEKQGQTKLTLTNLPISIVSVTTGNGVGGTKIYDFPLGFIKRLGCRALLTFSIASAKQADFTDGTPEGDVGVGTVAPADADALGTDATDDDWATAAAITFNNFAITTPVALTTEADGVQDGSGTAIDLYLNALIDAADIDDGVTTQILVSGYVWINWINQGGAAAV